MPVRTATPKATLTKPSIGFAGLRAFGAFSLIGFGILNVMKLSRLHYT